MGGPNVPAPAGGGGIAGSVSSLFGGASAIRQILLWNLVGELLSPILAPVQQELANVLWSRASVTVSYTHLTLPTICSV